LSFRYFYFNIYEDEEGPDTRWSITQADWPKRFSKHACFAKKKKIMQRNIYLLFQVS